MITKLKLNEKLLLPRLDTNVNYRCNYKIHKKGKEPDFSNLTESDGPACYSSFFSEYNLRANASAITVAKKKNAEYLTTMYLIRPAKNGDGFQLTFENFCRWVDLCEKYKLLPPKCISTKKIEIVPAHKNIPELIRATMTVRVEGVFQPTLYIWLDNLRHMRETQNFITSMLYLHDEIGINFYVAYAISSYINVTNAGHHCLPISRSSLYGQMSSAKGLTTLNNDSVIDLKIASILYRASQNFPLLLKNFKKVEENAGYVYKIKKERKDRARRWYCNNIMCEVSKKEKELIVNLGKVLHKDVDKIVYSSSEIEKILLHKELIKS